MHKPNKIEQVNSKACIDNSDIFLLQNKHKYLKAPYQALCLTINACDKS